MTANSSTKVAGKIERLFDPHDVNVAVVAQIFYGKADILDDGELDAVGRLFEDEQLRACHLGAVDGELLSLAA